MKFDAFALQMEWQNAFALHLECTWNAFALKNDAFALKTDAIAFHVHSVCMSFGVRVSAIRFLAMYHPTADDDLIVAVWLFFRDAITPQSGSRHTKLGWREVVKDGGY